MDPVAKPDADQRSTGATFSEGSVQAGSTLFVDTYWDYFYVLT
jgi:hypothetical protein